MVLATSQLMKNRPILYILIGPIHTQIHMYSLHFLYFAIKIPKFQFLVPVFINQEIMEWQKKQSDIRKLLHLRPRSVYIFPMCGLRACRGHAPSWPEAMSYR